METVLLSDKQNLIEGDFEARRALWAGIRYAGERFGGSCKIYTSDSPDPKYQISNIVDVPEVKTWKLVEAISLLAILYKAGNIQSNEILNLFGKTRAPIQFKEDGLDRYLWAQPTMVGDKSGLNGIPDLIVSSSPDTPSAETTLRVIECKCRLRFGAQDIRSEFGKAFDLKVATYFIWSFLTPKHEIVEGAKGLGLNLELLGFDTSLRDDLIAKPENMLSYVANTLAVSKNEKRFAVMLAEIGKDVSQKIDLLGA